MDAGAQNRPQLPQEQGLFLQTVPNAPNPQKRIGLFRPIQIRNLFVAANVQSSDNHRFSRHGPDHFRIGFILFLFRRGRIPVHKQKFRPVQADAVGAIPHRRSGAGRVHNICRQMHGKTIPGSSRRPQHFLELVPDFEAPGHLLRNRRDSRSGQRRFNDSRIAVDRQQFIVADPIQNPRTAQNRRDSHVVGQNCGMRSFAAPFGDNSFDVGGIQRRHQRSRDFLSHQDRFAVQIQPLFLRLPL